MPDYQIPDDIRREQHLGRGKESKFLWTDARVKAAELMAANETQQAVANKCGISLSALRKWLLRSEFIHRIAECKQAVQSLIEAKALTNAKARLDRYDAAERDMVRNLERLRTIIEERGASEKMQDVPGGKTGLLVERVKMIGNGEAAMMVKEHEVDTGLLKAMDNLHGRLLELQKQAAIECGQWNSESSKQVAPGGNLIVFVKEMIQRASDDDLKRLAESKVLALPAPQPEAKADESIPLA